MNLGNKLMAVICVSVCFAKTNEDEPVSHPKSAMTGLVGRSLTKLTCKELPEPKSRKKADDLPIHPPSNQ